MWDAITYPGPRYLLLTPKSTNYTVYCSSSSCKLLTVDGWEGSQTRKLIADNTLEPGDEHMSLNYVTIGWYNNSPSVRRQPITYTHCQMNC